MRKLALLVGISDYEEGLEPLPAAVRDVVAMQQVLVNPEMGGFADADVTVLTNPPRQEMADAIYTLFAHRQKDDLVLLYFSGHGILDEANEFYFSTRITRKVQGKLLPTTAVPAQDIRGWMEQSKSQRKVIILDSCFSGAFAKGVKAKDGGTVNPEQFLGGKGTAILTAATSTQYALTQDGFDLSIYTHYLVEGIRTGGADRDNDGMISVEELHTYARDKVKEAAPAMTPEFYPFREGGHKILLAKSPTDDPQLRYRKEVEKRVYQGAFSVPARRFLKSLQTSLPIAPAMAAAIEAEVIKPYQEFQRKVREYEETLIETVQEEAVLNDRVLNDLKDYQNHLGLRDEDVQAIRDRLLPPQAEHQPQTTPQTEQPAETEVQPTQRRRDPIVAIDNFTVELPKTDAVELSASKRKRLEIERESLQTDWEMQHEKLSTLRRACAIEAGVTAKFQIQQEIARAEESLADLENKLTKIEQTLTGSPVSAQPEVASSPQKPVKLNSTTTLPTQRSQPEIIALPSPTDLTFEFETATIDQSLKITRRQGRAEFFREILADGVELAMVKIPAGKFMMGAAPNEEEASEAEYPQHEVTIQSFYMGKYPVTQAQWAAVAALPKINQHLDPKPSYFAGRDRPVEQISWLQAVEFCNRLSQKTGRTYRLPSEAEWEYACRAGTTTPFHFGETLSTELANYDGNSTYSAGSKGERRQITTPVGQFPANGFGLYDMHGNVGEWCFDHWHETYQGAPIDGSAWLTNNNEALRLLRGGSWGFDPRNCRSAARDIDSRGYRDNYVGFRVSCAAARILP